jgi:hypothetical protein
MRINSFGEPYIENQSILLSIHNVFDCIDDFSDLLWFTLQCCQDLNYYVEIMMTEKQFI